MGWFSKKEVAQAVESEVRRPQIKDNPHHHTRSAGFFTEDMQRLLNGWESTSATIDFYLQQELRALRARSRKMVRGNPYGKRFLQTVKSNVIGPKGVVVQAQSVLDNGRLDTKANQAIEEAFALWGAYDCDKRGRLDFVEMQNMLISCAAQDGEFLVHKHVSTKAPYLQLEIIDPELLDVEKNTKTKNGEIRLGVEYNASGDRVRYHFKRKTSHVSGGYDNFERYTLEASSVLHGYLSEWPDQSRGIPWMHASLERSKHLEKYQESAIVKARSTASTMAVLKTPDGMAQYTGDEDGEGDVTFDEFEAGTIKDIGNRDVVNLDSDYPHSMYGPFVKAHLQGIASGLGISYHSLSSDLEGVNYSSIRTGTLEDREVYKGLQNWFVRQFVRPVFDEWLEWSIGSGAISLPSGVKLNRPLAQYKKAHFQGRRWAWVDPQKDLNANRLAIESRLSSVSQLIREQGNDPDEVFREIQDEQKKMRELGILPIAEEVATDEQEDD